MRFAVFLFGMMARDRKGATAVEYGLVVTLITIAVIAGIKGVGGTNQNIYNKVETAYRTSTGQ